MLYLCSFSMTSKVLTIGNSIGSAKSRDQMKIWFERWEAEKKKNGLFRVDEGDGKGGKW